MTYEESLQYKTRLLLWGMSQSVEDNKTMLRQLLQKVDSIMSLDQDLLDEISKVETEVASLSAFRDEKNAQIEALKAEISTMTGANAATQANISSALDRLKITEGEIHAITASTPSEGATPADPVPGV